MNSRASLGRRNKISNSSTIKGVATKGVATVASRSEIQRSGRSLHRTRRAEKAPHAFRQTVSLNSSELTALLRRQALAAVQQGDHTTAIALFDQLLNLNPSSARDYNNRGLVYFQSKQPEQAIADYDRALQLDPTLDSAYNNRANYFASQGMFLEAILDYDAALDLNPTNTRAWINQGITFRELEMYERAIECFDFALNLGRLQSHIYAERGRTYHLWGDWNCAIADYRHALDLFNQPSATAPGGTRRLQQQIDGWMDELLHPLR